LTSQGSTVPGITKATGVIVAGAAPDRRFASVIGAWARTGSRLDPGRGASDPLERPASLHGAVQEVDGKRSHDPAEVVLERDPVVGAGALPHPGANGRTGEDGIDHEIPGGHHEGAEEGHTDEVAAAPGRPDRPSMRDQVGHDVTRVDQHEPGEGDEDRDRAEPRAKGRGVVVRAIDEPCDDADLLEDPGRDRGDREEGQGEPHAQRH